MPSKDTEASSQEHEQETNTVDAKKAQERLNDEHGDDWSMLLIQDERSDSTQAAQYSFLRFPHPRHGKDVLFVHANNNVLEIRRAGRPNFSCWFVGDYCQKDGDLLMATKIDPLFLALPILEKARNKSAEHAGRFCDQEQIFSSWMEHSADCMALASSNGMDLHVICDVQDVGDDKYYRLNDDKVCCWARAKVQAAAAFKFPEFDTFGWKGPSEESAGKKKPDSVEDKIKMLERDDALRCEQDKIIYGASMVCDYLSDSWAAALLATYNLQPKHLQPAKVVTAPGDEQFKVHSTGSGRPRDDPEGPPTVKKAKVAACKADKIGATTKGLQSLSAFFKPKPKA